MIPPRLAAYRCLDERDCPTELPSYTGSASRQPVPIAVVAARWREQKQHPKPTQHRSAAARGPAARASAGTGGSGCGRRPGPEIRLRRGCAPCCFGGPTRPPTPGPPPGLHTPRHGPGHRGAGGRYPLVHRARNRERIWRSFNKGLPLTAKLPVNAPWDSCCHRSDDGIASRPPKWLRFCSRR